MPSTDAVPPLSQRLEAWLTAEGDKTVGSLVEHFGPQSFGVVFVLLLAVPALPLPTGGVTHLFEAVAMLLALELVAGRDELWLPKRWRDAPLKALARPAVRDRLVRRIRGLERLARPRLSGLLATGMARRAFGAIVLGLSVTAFVAPPFTGLDTLPALGAVVLSFGVLFGDALLAAVGVAIGLVGVGLVVALGHAVVKLF